MGRNKVVNNDVQHIAFNALSATLKEQLAEKEKEFHGDDAILSMELLTRSNYISGSRTIMTTGHMKQMMTLLNPEFPKIFTEYENMVGKYSTSIHRAKRNWKVLKKITKFRSKEGDYLYTLLVRDEDTGYYDVIMKKIVEDLTEKFGFRYNNERLDSIKEDEHIEKGEVLYKSTSYDEYNNYRFGVNATYGYFADLYTTEDAIRISKSFAERMKCVETETVRVSINDNDILLNLYGDDKCYKCFPDIGEYINDKVICATRRVTNDQLFYDFKESNLRKINFGEDTLYVEGSKGGRVVDIRVYSNKSLDELNLNDYHAQLNGYFENELRYYGELKETLEPIVEQNKDHSRNLNYLYKKAKDITSGEVKWCEQQSKKPFNNVVLEFVIEREVPLRKGSKITGLFGNKGVVSDIVDDKDMPVLENGKRIDVMLNCLGVIGRLNSFQLYEQSVNFINNRTIDRMKTLETDDQRAELLFTILSYFSTRQAREMSAMYAKYTDTEKAEFFEDIYKNGIYVHIPPFWHERPLFDVLIDIYDRFGDWLTPYQVFIKKNGRWRPMMNKMIVGEMYIIRLKQTAAKGQSSRAVGGVSLIGTPIKDAQAKENKILYSKTPCRLGLDEVLNLLIGMDARDLAKQNLSYRNSIEGTHDLPVQLLRHGQVEDLRDDKYIKNRNVEVLQAYLKTMGYKLESREVIKEVIFENIDDAARDHIINGKKIFCTDKEYIHLLVEEKVDEIMANDLFIGTHEEWHEKYDRIREEVLNDIRNTTFDFGEE